MASHTTGRHERRSKTDPGAETPEPSAVDWDQPMTANDNTRASGKDCTDTDNSTDTDDDRLVFDSELGAGHMMAESFVAPGEAAVQIEPKAEGLLRVRLREATNARGLVTTWVLDADDARAVADRLATVAAEVEDAAEGADGD